MNAKAKIFLFCLLAVIVLFTHLLLFNVHFSRLYVQHQANLYPANITLSQRCTWAKNTSFDFKDFKPQSFILISRMLYVVYKQHGIIPIIRGGSFLHAFRELSADIDMDVFLIVPRNLTMWDAYSKIRSVIKSDNDFQNITLETQNVIISGIFFDKSDAVRVSFNGKKILDVNVLHETFINDPDLQAPCLKQMHCKRLRELDDDYIKANSHHITTKNLFESLCECNYMDSVLFCFNLNGAKYLEVRFGQNYTRRVPEAKAYDLIYERPRKTWRSILATFPSIMHVKRLFEGHKDEHNTVAYNTSEVLGLLA